MLTIELPPYLLIETITAFDNYVNTKVIYDAYNGCTWVLQMGSMNKLKKLTH